MALDIWAGINECDYTHRKGREIGLESNGTYWFLYRYFEAANLDRSRGELLDLYGGNQIEGYQLDRLKEELELAREEISFKPKKWSVITGWNTKQSAENEIREEVLKTEVLATIKALLDIIAYAKANELKLIAMGD